MNYQPKNPIAEFVDEYGDRQIIHRPAGRKLKVFKGCDTPALKMNRAAAVLIGKNIRARREALGLSMKEMGEKAGLSSATPKQYVHSIEKAIRTQGVRIGTLYAIAYALECHPSDLMPTVTEVLVASGVDEAAAPRLRPVD